MRRLRWFLPMVPLVLSMVPATAQASEPLVTCAAPEAGTTVVRPSQIYAPDFDAPMFSFPTRAFKDLKFQLDLSPATAEHKAIISSTLNWEIETNDWDLILFDGAGAELSRSEGFQPFDPATEAVSHLFTHCSLFTLRILNFQAIPVDAIDPLDFTVQSSARKTSQNPT